MSSPADPRLEPARRLTADILAPMKSAFVGKDEIVDLMGVCLVGGENLFLLGPPGTAKSALVHELARRLGGTSFDYLLTRFTEPNELFGPFDIRRLREGDLVTNTEGMLPEASFVFLDELLNANSAILNSLLMVLNERIFRRGRETRRLPTLMVVGASNSLPEEEALRALFDRFLLRVRCDNVAQEQLTAVLVAGWNLDRHRAQPADSIGVDEIRALQQLLPEVDLAAVRAPFVELVHRLRHAGLALSDRRVVKLQRLIAASAILCGRLAADATDLWVLRYVWDTEEQQQILASLVQDAIDRSAPSNDHEHRHPRSQGGEMVDPETLARDLDRLAARLHEENVPAADRACIADQVGVLAARCQWIADAGQRTHLAQRIEELWQTLQPAGDTT